MDLPLLHGLAETQLGLVTRSQLLALGFSDDTIAGLVRRGYLRVAHPGVYVVPGTPADPRRRLLAAAMAAGPQAVVSRQSALWLHRLEPGLPLRIEVTGPVTAGTRIPGVAIHRTRGLEKSDVVSLGPVPVTSPARTLVDMTRDLFEARLGRVLDRAVAMRLLTVEEMAHTLDRLCAGRHGMAKLRRVVNGRLDEPVGMESTGQQWLYRTLVSEGYAPFVELPIRDESGIIVASADCGFPPPVYLDCEYDGSNAHDNPAAAAAARRRDALLSSLGWHTLRADATTRNDPREFLAAVARRFADKGVPVPGRAS